MNLQNENISNFIEKNTVFSIVDLAEIMHCSIRTAQRKIQSWNLYRSFNFNGRFYVPEHIPAFDMHGIWKYKRILFSKFGNLKATFNAVVHNSETGLTAIEISKIMGINAYTFLSHFRTDANFRRERVNGIFVYYSDDPERFKEQIIQRENIIRSSSELNLPSNSDAIIIFVELIKHPKITMKQLIRKTRKKGANVSAEKINNLLLYHRIEKKTPDLH